MEPILLSINKELQANEERSEYVKSFEEVYVGFRRELDKTDPVFESYKKKINTGSHAIKTRVGVPNEFDINICIKLPGILNQGVELKNSTRRGFIQIKTSQDNWKTLKKNQIWEKCKSVEKWIDDEGYLVETKLRTWMESKVQNVFTNLGPDRILHINNSQYKLGSRKSGPAFTLLVKKLGTNVEFDVDLVPAIVFEYPNWPPNIKTKYATQSSHKEWFAIAKPLSSDQSRFWRPSLALHEIEILHGQQRLKSALRLLKALKNNNQMTYLPTYYINTLFMWKKSKEDASYWNKPLNVIFMDMLNELADAMDHGEILCYWDTQQNLLDNLKASQVEQASNRLKGIIKSINKNNENLKNIILGSTRTTPDYKPESALTPEANNDRSFCVIM